MELIKSYPADFAKVIERYSDVVNKTFGLKKIMKKYGRCQKCGWCCRNERLTIFLPDAKRLGERLKSEHIQKNDEVSITLKLPCPYITDKNQCEVYSKRSGICKTYPFLLHYTGLLSIAYDCPLGKLICDDLIKFCQTNGVKILGEDGKTDQMKEVDKMVNEKKLNSGEGYSSNIVNVPFEVYQVWRRSNVER